MSAAVTVAIPVRNGLPLLAGVLEALSCQTVEHELLVCDSGSTDGSVELARRFGARVLQIPPKRFGHGATRNLLVERATGARVALLTQDAQPRDPDWLERLLGALDAAPDVALAYGPYVPREDAPLGVRLELEGWFDRLGRVGEPRLERLSPQERIDPPLAELTGRRGFFTDANACIARSAWERVPFREVAYAEDRMLALDMMRAGYAKAYVPNAPVLHSHRFTLAQEVRRGFDEWCALREVYGFREPASVRRLARDLRGALGRARRELASGGAGPAEQATALTSVGVRHLARRAGALLGSRAGGLPEGVQRWLSLEGRAGSVAG